VPLRPYLTTYVNLCWVIGQLIAAGILKGMLTLESQWAYRIPYAIQWVWPLPIAAAAFFAPESPWYVPSIVFTDFLLNSSQVACPTWKT